jgi:hypothetical protein
LLHRQVGRLLAIEDAIDVAGRTPVLIEDIVAVGDQAAGVDELAPVEDRRQLVSGRQRDDRVAVNHCQRAACQNQASMAGARQVRDVGLDLAGVAHVDGARLHSERRRHRLDDGELADPGC